MAIEARYDYIEQIRGTQVFGEFTLLRCAREYIPGFEIQALRIGVGEFTDSTGTGTGRWRLQLVSFDIDESLYTISHDSLPAPPTGFIDQYEYKNRDYTTLGISGGIGILDLDCSQRADRHFRWLHTSPGAFARFHSFIEIEARLQCVLGLASYNLGDLAYQSLDPHVLNSYTGFEGTALGTLRFAYRGASIALKAESANIFAGRTVNFLTVGAKATVVLPPIPFAWLLSAEVVREHTHFAGKTAVLDGVRASIILPLFIAQPQHYPWM